MLEQEREAFEEEKRAMTAMLVRDQDVIKLNVGGTLMATTR